MSELVTGTLFVLVLVKTLSIGHLKVLSNNLFINTYKHINYNFKLLINTSRSLAIAFKRKIINFKNIYNKISTCTVVHY